MTMDIGTLAILLPMLLLLLGLGFTVVIDPYIQQKQRRIMLLIVVLCRAKLMGKRAVRQSLTSCFEESSVGLWLFCQARFPCPVSLYHLARRENVAPLDAGGHQRIALFHLSLYKALF